MNSILFRHIVVILFFVFTLCSNVQAQLVKTKDITTPDSIELPLNIRIGLDIASPAIHLLDEKSQYFEGIASYEWNEKWAATISIGYAKTDISKFNYNYLADGFYIKPGVELNLLKPQIGEGLYFAGIGFKYGYISYAYETTDILIPNYWGDVYGNINKLNATTHILEITPGFSSRVSKHLVMGWRLSLMKHIYTSTLGPIEPMYIPGYGYKNKTLNVGFRYYLLFNISRKTIRVKWREKSDDDFDSL